VGPLRDAHVQLAKLCEAKNKNPELLALYQIWVWKEFELINALDRIFNEEFRDKLKMELIFHKIKIDEDFKTIDMSSENIISWAEEMRGATELKKTKINIDDENTIHDYRLAIKKYRYVVEIVCEAFPNQKIHLKSLKKMQNLMGQIQDISVFERAIVKTMKNISEKTSIEVNNYLMELRADKQLLINNLIYLVKDYEAPKINDAMKKAEYF
jgi:CHAD domain-containing protein